MESLIRTKDGYPGGSVTVNPDGSGTFTLGGATAGASYVLRFCPFSNGNTSCTNVATAATDANGNGSSNFQFPGHGAYSGVFFASTGGIDEFNSGFSVPTGGTTFHAGIYQAASIAGGLGTQQQQEGVVAEPITSGNVSTGTGDAVQVNLNGVPPSATYDFVWCGNGGGSSCQLVDTLTSDASGNASSTIMLSSHGFPENLDYEGLFLVTMPMKDGSNPIVYIMGLKVP